MATLFYKRTNYDKIKQTTTSTLPQPLPLQRPQQQQHRHNNDEDDDGDYFYHIKQCYQPPPPPTLQNSRTSNINQRISSTIITTTTSHVLHSLSYNGHSLTALILMGCLLLFQFQSTAVAAPQSCILCDKNDLLAKDPQTQNYEEYLFEHQVTKQDAITALRQLNESFYEGSASDSSCNAVRCTEKVMNYCTSTQFINDHCWCELGHSVEGLPFVPHICYVGEKIYKASVGSCFFYEEVKECCCSSVLAKEWRHISAASTIYNKTLFHDYYVFVFIYFLYLLIIGRSYY